MKSYFYFKENLFLTITFFILFIIILILTFLNYSTGLDAKSVAQKHVASLNSKAKIAIVIDDFGLGRQGVKEMMEVKAPLTFAVMPFLAFSKQDAENAHKKGYEVIVHLPLQYSKTKNNWSWMGPRPVKLCQSDYDIKLTVSDAISDVPFAKGLNYHIGVAGCENERVMGDILQVVKEKNIYFYDSKTSIRTKGTKIAKELGIPYAERDIFLEHGDKSKDHIKKMLQEAADIAKRKGVSCVIGHVGAAGGLNTVNALNEMIPVLQDQGIKFVFVSQVLQK